MWKVFFGCFFLAVSGVALELAVKNLLECKKGWWNQGILLLGCAVQINMVIFFRDWINLIPTFLCFLLCLLCACRGSFLKKVTIGLMIMSGVFAFNAVIDNFFQLDRYCTAMLRILFAVIFYLATKRLRMTREYELSPALWRLMLLLTCTPIGVVITVALLNRQSYRMDFMENLQALILMILSGLSLVGLLWAVTVLIRQQKMEQERMLDQINQQYYESLEQQNFEVRRLKHDMANHLQALAVLPEEEKQTYIQSLLESAALTGPRKYCGEPVVNAVLSVKQSLMEQKKIRFCPTVGIPAELPFEKADICALFGNALDNAMEACDRLAAEERKISLETHMRKGLFVLKVSNPIREVPRQEGGRFLTEKQDRSRHGFGILSMQEIVRRHGGGIQIQTSGGVFALLLYLPLEDQVNKEGEE